MKKNKLDLPKVIGHRGACAYAPENTLISMRKAAALNTEWVEFDVMLTSDGIPIVIHDETLDRTTNSQGHVANTPYSSIQQLDGGSWFAQEFLGEKIPTLVELLTCVDELNLGINVEIKPALGKDEATAKSVMQTLKQYWHNKPTKLLVSSFSLISLQVVRNLDNNINLGLLVHHWFSGWQEKLDEFSCISLNANQEILTPAIVKQVKKTGRYVLAYTVNDIKRAQELFSWGVDAVFSNVPDLIIKSSDL